MNSEMNEFDKINHKVYLDVLDASEPVAILSTNKTYIDCYTSWRNLAGEKHFDPHFDDIDLFDYFWLYCSKILKSTLLRTQCPF